MNKRYVLFFLLLITIVLPALSQTPECPSQTYVLEHPYSVEKITPPKGHKIKNVILMIGDGMSLMHVYSAWTANRGKLWLDNCQYVGLSKTYCANKLITDSGAGGTALSSGYKTNYHSVGVDTNGKPLKSLCTLAQEKGKSSGIAVTCRLWDATPADFCCHNVDRDKEMDIVADYVNCGIDYAFGGGAAYFENRPDGRDLFKELQSKGYQTPRTWADVEKIKSGKVFAIPYSKDTPVPAVRGDLLARASIKGLDLLNQNKKGFFMMIEGSQLDDYGHSNDLDMLMQETHDFDKTIGEVMKWAAKDGETLVVVTADHETGGLTLVDGNLKKGEIVCKFSTHEHSGVMVPVYAFGPGSENFSGIYENTEIFWKIKKLLKL
ncbi:alkaline phosphatase [uncultured Bacteroides sp.]|uniref:alkaline phosphatase n=1 Tax=uncultured Bacteroides sp. TaxID=162156 RepID=UPI002AAB589D|nr:alkaline phosphatase [uncultured Bacteroides sp.]